MHQNYSGLIVAQASREYLKLRSQWDLKDMHRFWGRTAGPGEHDLLGVSGRLTDNIVRAGLNHKS
jgi:hypothetical protein